MATSILLAHPQLIYRHGVKSLLQDHAEFRIVGETDDGRRAVELAIQLRPAVILMDANMPRIDGVAATAQIRKRWAEARIIVLSLDGEKWPVADAVRVGAAGVLRKDCRPEEMLQAIRMVASGGVYLSPSMANTKDKPSPQAQPQTSQGYAKLTARQLDVLRLLANGHTSKEIAFKLKISPKTVDTHRLELMDKLQIFNVALLTKFAVRECLVAL